MARHAVRRELHEAGEHDGVGGAVGLDVFLGAGRVERANNCLLDGRGKVFRVAGPLLGDGANNTVFLGGGAGGLTRRDDGSGFGNGGVAGGAGTAEFREEFGAVEGPAGAELRAALAHTLGLDEGGGHGIAQQVHALFLDGFFGR